MILLASLSLLALALALGSSLSVWVKFPLCLFILLLLRVGRRQELSCCRNRLILSRDQYRLTDLADNSIEELGILVGFWDLSPWFLLLVFRSEHRAGACRLLIWRDSCDGEAWRQLRRQLSIH